MDRKRKEYDLYKKTRQAAVIKWLISDRKKSHYLAAQIEIASKKLEFYQGLNRALARR